MAAPLQLEVDRVRSDILPTDEARDAVLSAWLRGLSAESPDARFRGLYVDAFAGAEWAFGTGDPARHGSRAVDAAIVAAECGAVAALVEEDPALVERLQAELSSRGAAGRVRRDPGLDAATTGEILLIEADFRNVADALAAVPPGTNTLVWAAPTGARRLTWGLLESLLADPALDLLLSFPAQDFVRQGATRGPLADLPPLARRQVEGCSALLGDPRHAWLSRWRQLLRSGGESAAQADLLGHFASRLAERSGVRLLKQALLHRRVRLEPLFLVTTQPQLALTLNEVLERVGTLPPPAPDAVTDLFGVVQTSLPTDPVPPLAEKLWSDHRGAEVPLGELIVRMAVTTVTPGQLRAALRLLRRGGRADFRSLTAGDDAIAFHEAPLPRARHRRPVSKGDIDLFGPG